MNLNTQIKAEQIINAQQQKDGRVIVTLGNDPITDDVLSELKIEVDNLKRSRIWAIITETLRAMAIETAVNKSKNFEEVLEGKMALHNIGLMESIINIIEKTKLPEKKSSIIIP